MPSVVITRLTEVFCLSMTVGSTRRNYRTKWGSKCEQRSIPLAENLAVGWVDRRRHAGRLDRMMDRLIDTSHYIPFSDFHLASVNSPAEDSSSNDPWSLEFLDQYHVPLLRHPGLRQRVVKFSRFNISRAWNRFPQETPDSGNDRHITTIKFYFAIVPPSFVSSPTKCLGACCEVRNAVISYFSLSCPLNKFHAAGRIMNHHCRLRSLTELHPQKLSLLFALLPG